MRLHTCAVSAILLWTTSASPLAPRQEQSPSPCAAIKSLAQAAPAAATPTIAAEAAWQCLQSVPLNTSAALDLIQSIKPYLKWQSTTAYLRDPPAEYVKLLQPAVDIPAGIDQIEANLNEGVWTKEYDFGYALYRLLQSSHDGHLTFFPDVIFKIFTWGRPVPLVSISEDGEKLPSIFAYSDILSTSGGATFQPSTITQINGQNALDFLYDFSQVGSLQDRDALWNNMFYELAQVSLGRSGSGTGSFSGGGRGRVIYPGANTDLTFANGSTVSYQNYARVLVNFTGISNGEDLYKKFFAYPDTTFNLNGDPPAVPATTTTTASTTTSTAAATGAPPGYPSPIVRKVQDIGGYYINDPAYADVAVLAVPSFVGDSEAEIPFQQTSQEFFAAAKAAGKTKLIIDVSANGGGTILQGYDLFKQFFPSMDPYSAADRFRAHEAVDLVGILISNISGQYPRSLNNDELIVDLQSSPQNYRSDLVAETSQHFTSWSEKYGPKTYQNDTFSSKFKWDFNDPLITANSGGIEITGYGNRTNFTQPFAAEDIVIVYDGYCASTCTIFSELMRQLAGVETVAMGGRPNTNQIQAVGGVKGTNNYGWNYIQSLVEITWELSSPAQKASYQTTELNKYGNYLYLLRQVGTPNINFRDGIRKDDDEMNVPLQFKYEEADCRLFYTSSMTVDVSAVWKSVADVKWFGTKTCVAGALGGKKGYMKEKRTTSTKREVSRKLNARQVGSSQLTALRESLLLETDTWMGPVADGFMVP